MIPWTDDLTIPEPEPLTDADIVRIGMKTMRRYRKPFGVVVSSKLAAAKMRRLYARRVVAS